MPIRIMTNIQHDGHPAHVNQSSDTTQTLPSEYGKVVQERHKPHPIQRFLKQ